MRLDARYPLGRPGWFLLPRGKLVRLSDLGPEAVVHARDSLRDWLEAEFLGRLARMCGAGNRGLVWIKRPPPLAGRAQRELFERKLSELDSLVGVNEAFAPARYENHAEDEE